jgi:hypothetical protein
MRLSFDQIKHSSDMLISAPGVVVLFLFAWSYISAAEWALKPLMVMQKNYVHINKVFSARCSRIKKMSAIGIYIIHLVHICGEAAAECE